MDLFKGGKKRIVLKNIAIAFFAIAILYKIGILGYEFGQWLKAH
jgi:hypothetical protein